MYSPRLTASLFVLWNWVLTAQGLHQSLFSRQTAKTVEIPLFQDAQKAAYYANITVGTPGNTITVQVDTGSSDLWVFSDQAVCQVRRGCIGGAFSPGSSSSFHDIGQDAFYIQYGDGTEAEGDLITEKVQLGSASVNNLTMAAVTAARGASAPLHGILGIGFPGGESIRNTGGNEYYNLPYALTSQGIISEPVYSLYLNDIGAQSGSLLFGGIDTDKIDGELTVVDVLLNPRDPRLLIPLTSVSIVNSNGDSSSVPLSSGSGDSTSTPVLLDSGSTAVFLPENAVREIYQQLGVSNNGIIPCSAAKSGTKFAFQFGGSPGATINVDMSEMVEQSQDVCELLVTVSDDIVILGDAFLRSAYVAYDLGHAQIGLGQAKFNSPDEKVVPLTSSASVPSVIGTVPAASIGPGTGFGGGNLPGTIVGGAASMAVSSLPTAIPHGSSQVAAESMSSQLSRPSSSIAASTAATHATAAGGSAPTSTGSGASSAPATTASSQGNSGTRTSAPVESPPAFTNVAAVAADGMPSFVVVVALAFLNACASWYQFI